MGYNKRARRNPCFESPKEEQRIQNILAKGVAVVNRDVSSILAANTNLQPALWLDS